MKKINAGLFCVVLMAVLTSCRTTTSDNGPGRKSQPAEITVKVVTDKGRTHANKVARKLCADDPEPRRKKFLQSVCTSSDCKRKAYRYSCIK